MARYPKLPHKLRLDLQLISPSRDHAMEYFPCRATLTNGELVDCVYVAEESRYFRAWGVWPEQDSGKRHFKIEQIASLEESPSRLPVEIANQLYRAGETRTGAVEFTLIYSDGLEAFFSTGNAVDSVRHPNGKKSKDVAAVRTGGAGPQSFGLPYFWCLHS